MNFEEFKAAMKKHNELVRELRKNTAFSSEVEAELVKNNDAIAAFYRLNPDMFKVDVHFLTRHLDEFMKGVQKPTKVDFITLGKDGQMNFDMVVTERDRIDKSRTYNRIYEIAPISTGKHGGVCANLQPVLTCDSAYIYRRDVIFSIAGFEDALWAAVEANYNEQVKEEIGLLTKTKERNEQMKAELRAPDYVAKETAKLDENTRECEQKLAALNEQLKK